jgi:dihydropyrimidinase
MTISAETHHMNIDYNAYEGMRVQGVTETVLSRGKVIIEKGKYEGTPGEGRFLKRSTFGWK